MKAFSDRLLGWFRQYGRHDLPWQQNRSAYRVWVSEIMLQQTQVNTVIPYYQRFMQRFVDVEALAVAETDEVMLYWAGLGYYSRARNLHRAAGVIMEVHGGCFPEDYEQVLALPGIGPSTAGAILAQAKGQRHAILDGNVKRVLARHDGISGWPGLSKVAKQLWRAAEQNTPLDNIVDYTQAVMDLGATVCTRSNPGCATCPVAADCFAYQNGRVAEFPGKKPRKQIPVRQKRLLIIRNQRGQYLMEKRPPNGIWGGLWSLPELELDEQVDAAVLQKWRLKVDASGDLPTFRHSFTHFHLDITPCEVSVEQISPAIADSERFQWYSDIEQLALAAPVNQIFQTK